MPIYARVLLLTAAFLTVAGVVYLVTGAEYVGGPLIVATAAAMTYVGVYLRRAVQLADRQPEGSPVELPHVGPTIWPFVFSLAAGVIAIGALAVHWLLVIGVVLFGLAGVGWVLDIRRQHRAPAHH